MFRFVCVECNWRRKDNKCISSQQQMFLICSHPEFPTQSYRSWLKRKKNLKQLCFFINSVLVLSESLEQVVFKNCSDHSHRSSRNDGARNDEPRTRNGILDAFLHCGNEIVPAFPSRNVERCIVPVPRWLRFRLILQMSLSQLQQSESQTRPTAAMLSERLKLFFCCHVGCPTCNSGRKKN